MGGFFLPMFFVFFHMGPYGSQNFNKSNKSNFLQITNETFQSFPEFSSQWSSQNYGWDIEILEIEILIFFFFFVNMALWEPKLQNATPPSNHF